jgi:multicomponent Na+:H+ antiporter subunit C
MELWLVPVIAVLFALAYYLLLQRSLSRIILGLLVLSNAANLALFVAPGLTRGWVPETDPLPQALILTAIVIGMAVLAFALALSLKLKQKLGVDDVDQLRDES